MISKTTPSPPTIYQAPMEGVIDHHVRSLLCAIGGVDICVTEFVRVTDQRLPRRVFTRLCPELLHGAATADGTPVRLQLLGGNPAAMADNARKAVAVGANAIDLNFGCPAKSVNKSDGGACLLQTPHRLEAIVGAVRRAVPQAIPITAKIRLGYNDRSTYLDNALAAAAGGASELAVHARAKVDGYKPPVYWACIGEIRQRLDIPVIANGDIWTLEAFKRCREVTGCEAFMLGRSLLARPDLGLQIKTYCAGERYCPMRWQQVVGLLWDYYQTTREIYPSKYLGNRIKQWLAYLKLAFPEARVFFEKLKRLRIAEAIEAVFIRELQDRQRELKVMEGL
ncbi:tRNA dihydrouridine synthase [Microbulbifer spongiae]|uniref:tRNA-dihydrouridine(16) synthase n=1 Tax=Microbulbifer spongiae TaxID=2944933 RepID=A0ABY9EDG9_9GAMM|nr:tRNA-dihydrouridine synthase [Microbulbifer sp. MI-G]WKD51073.1 tRNA-dihydrouridine synthase [Microbulbifer sp. MI-G]